MIQGSTAQEPESEPGTAAHIAGAERLLSQGEPLLAYNDAATGLQQEPGNARLRQLQALALARAGDVERANRLLGELAAEGVDDAEAQGALARTHKDLGLAARNAADRTRHLEAAFRLYHDAYAAAQRRGDAAAVYYTGINAAAVAVLRGDRHESQQIAAHVLEICDADARAHAGQPDNFWRRATQGEAALILGQIDSAIGHYAAAKELARGRVGDLSSTRRQGKLLAEHLGLDAGRIADLLSLPPVVVFAGPRVGPAECATTPFSASSEASVRTAIRAVLAAHQPLAVYGSAGCGAEILILEVARDLGAETHVVLPFTASEFRSSCVEGPKGGWGVRFDRVLAAADSVTITSDHRATGSAATYEYANLVMTGLGTLRAQLLDTALRGLAVWDCAGDKERSLARAAVSTWERRGLAIDHVELGATADSFGQQVAAPAVIDDVLVARAGVARHEIKSLLFADVVGYSRLSEDQIPNYVTGFLQAVANLNGRTRHRCEHVETAGDGLYMVFPNTADAANYALELSVLISGTDWTSHGLPADFNLRIALHCGPVYCGRDPITGFRLFTGPHVSRTARIEPITPPGQVYASSAFAAVAAADGTEGIGWHYVGRIPLAKRSGSLMLYHLHAAH